VLILKFFLHISHEEQTRRLQSRIDDPDKHWKLSESDFKERQFWDEYTKAYEELLPATSRKHAPWFVIPSDHKGYRNVAISQILVDVMKDLKLKYPKPTMDPSKIQL
jgi:polyphosphate kinase 2 (PPK2 family)